jgi:hypothetical protein
VRSRRAHPIAGSGTSYASLLRSAGFVEIEEHDLNAAYHTTASRKLAETERMADDLIDVLGRQEFDQTVANAGSRWQPSTTGCCAAHATWPDAPPAPEAPRPWLAA